MKRAFDIMVGEVFFVSPEDSVAHARRLFINKKISRLLVMEGGKVTGIVTDREMSEALYKTRDSIESLSVSEIMRKGFVIADPQDSPEMVAKAMTEKGFAEATVYDSKEGRVLGMISKTDLVGHFIENYAGERTVADMMRREVQTIGRAHSIFRAAKEMEANKIGRLVVVDGKPCGIITARDLALATFGMRPERLVYTSKKGTEKVFIKPMIVEDLMKPDLLTIPSKSDAVSAAKLMVEKGIGSVVALDRGEMQGIVTKTDIVRFLAEKA